MKTLAVTLVLVALGIAAVVYSPGLVPIGIVLILGALAIGARAIYRHRRAANRP